MGTYVDASNFLFTGVIHVIIRRRVSSYELGAVSAHFYDVHADATVPPRSAMGASSCFSSAPYRLSSFLFFDDEDVLWTMTPWEPC